MRTPFRGVLALAALLSACVGGGNVPPRTDHVPPRSAGSRPVRITPSTPLQAAPVTAAPGITAATSGVQPGPPIASLPLSDEAAERARTAFALTCPSLMKRADATGLTRAGDWDGACSAARRSGPARDFFVRNFETVQVGDGKAFATGYYIPEIAGSRDRRAGYDTPIYARPSDLIDVDLGRFSDSLKGRKIRGRVEGTNFIPYFDRTAIEQGSLDGRARILAWARDPVEMFFLQIQGSGLLRLPDGSVMRIGYDSQNGRDYTGIGALMKSRGLLGPGQTSMQGIVAWLHDHPAEGQAIMRENKSFVFFRELQGPPLGALGYAVYGQVSVAADPKFVPLGAPIFLSMDRADATGLWVAQDTGGAIKGANRIDTFWGAGEDARAIAGGMAARGTAFLLMPIGTVARLSAPGPYAGSDNVGSPPRP